MTKNKIVLAVDDMSENLTLIRSLLQDYFDVRLAKSAKMALGLLDHLKVDLILLDIEMPDMSGFTFLQKLAIGHSLNKTTPVIMVTSHADKDFIEKAAASGAKGYLLKPINDELLYKKIESAIGIPLEKISDHSIEDKLNELMVAAVSGESAQAEKLVSELDCDVADEDERIRNAIKDIAVFVGSLDYENAIFKIKDLLRKLPLIKPPPSSSSP